LRRSLLGCLLGGLLLLGRLLLTFLRGVAFALRLVLATLLRRLRFLAPLLAPFARPPRLRLLATLSPRFRTWRAAAFTTLATLLLPAALLLELLNLASHVLAGLRILPEAHFIVAAVGTALPTLGVGALTGGAENAFGERHGESVAHCTLPA
jgi:hypothetical protein